MELKQTDEKEKKKISSFKFDKVFKNDLMVAADIEGISVTKLIEREMNRYLRAFKRAAIEMNRRKEIERRIQLEKNGE